MKPAEQSRLLALQARVHRAVLAQLQGDHHGSILPFAELTGEHDLRTAALLAAITATTLAEKLDGTERAIAIQSAALLSTLDRLSDLSDDYEQDDR